MSTARVVAERYSLIRPIGHGSAGVVYVANDLVSGVTRAVKLIPARPGLHRDEAARFATEVMRAVEHPGVVSVLDAGLDDDGHTLFVVTELLHGVTLRDLIADRSNMDIERRLDLLERVLEPLAAAHDQGVVHGDLTATNVFEVHARGAPDGARLLDLGLSELLRSASYSAPGLTLTSAHSLAPERVTGGRFGPAADVWAFGVLLYNACAGRGPFTGLSQDSIARAITDAPHRPLDLVQPDAPTQIARLVDLCLEKQPSRRPHDARAVLRLLKTLRSGVGQSRAGVMSLDTMIDHGGSAPEPPPDELDAALRRAPRDPQVHRALLAYYQARDIPDGVWLTAAALDFLGAATREEERLHHHLQKPTEVSGERGLDASGWAALLHPDQDPRIDAVWRELAPAVASLYRRTDADAGLADARKVDLGRAEDALAKAFRLALVALRPGVLPRLYRGPAGTAPSHLPTSPPASMFGRGFEEPLPAGALAFVIGRHVAHYRSAHRVCTVLHEPDALEAVFDAGVRVGLGQPAETVDQRRMADLLREHLGANALPRLRTAAQRLGTTAGRVDLGTWRRAVELGCCRAGITLGGSLEGATWMLRWTRERRRLPCRDAVDDLLRFWSSGNHVRARHLLDVGIE